MNSCDMQIKTKRELQREVHKGQRVQNKFKKKSKKKIIHNMQKKKKSEVTEQD